MDTKQKLINFKNSQTVRELKAYYKTPSLMEVYGINRKEIRHTSFLKWLFNDYNNSSESIKKLIDILITSHFFNKEEIFKSNEDIYNQLIIENYEIKNIKTRIPNSTKKNQVDLFISFSINDYDLNIIIENKVYSNESNNQTDRYYKEFKKNEKKSFNFYVYLTPISTLKLEKLEEPECVNKKYIQINYQSILENILEPILKTTKDNTLKLIIEDYIIALGFPYNNNKNHSFMAISTKETELLNSFWDENQDLILKAIEATKENEHVAPEIRERAEEISKLFQNKDDKIGAYVLRNLKELFYKKSLPNEEIINLENKEYCKDILDINFPLLVKVKAHIVSPKRYWKKPISVNDYDYYICSEWYEREDNDDRPHFDKWFNKWNK